MDRVNGQDFVIVDGKRVFGPGNEAQGVPATECPAEWLTGVQEELALFIEAQGITLDSGDNTQLQDALNELIASRAAVKNFLINGAFEVWQRGSSFDYNHLVANVPRYFADRWVVTLGSSVPVHTAELSRTSIAPTDIEAGARFGMRVGPFGEITTQTVVEQRVEGIDRFDDDPVVFSFYARAYNVVSPGSAASFDIVVSTSKSYGAGQGAALEDTSGPITIDENWQRYSVALDTGSAAGGAITEGNYQGFRILCPAGATHAFEVALAQVEYGTKATAYEVRPRAMTDLLCARYFETSYPAAIDTPGTATYLGARGGLDAGLTGGDLRGLDTRFRIEKRATPTIQWYSPATGTIARVFRLGADRPVLSTFNPSTQNTGAPQITPVTGALQTDYGHWTAEAEL